MSCRRKEDHPVFGIIHSGYPLALFSEPKSSTSWKTLESSRSARSEKAFGRKAKKIRARGIEPRAAATLPLIVRGGNVSRYTISD